MNQVKEVKIEGLEVKEEKQILDEVVEETKRIANVDYELTREIIEQLSGIYRPVYVYNIPRFSPTGLTYWPACDRIAGGCPDKGQKHVHILGITARGTEAILQTYGNIDVETTRPEVFEDAGEMNWFCKVTITDHRMNNSMEIWHDEPVLMKSGNEYKVNQYAARVCQSKARRNAILYTIPTDAHQRWINAYIAGEEPEETKKKETARYKESGTNQTKETKQPIKAKPKEKPNSELLEMLKKFCDESKLDEQLVTDFFRYMNKSQGQVKIYLAKAISGGDMQKTIIEIENYRDTMLTAKAEEDTKQAAAAAAPETEVQEEFI